MEVTIIAAGDAISDKHLALCELIRTLAEQRHAAVPEGLGTRLAGTYLTALWTLNAAISAAPAQVAKPRNGRAAIRGIRNGVSERISLKPG